VFCGFGNETGQASSNHAIPRNLRQYSLPTVVFQHTLKGEQEYVSRVAKTTAHVGDTVTYTITVSNPSTDTAMTKVSVSDTLLGDLSNDFPATLAAGASQTKTYTHTVLSGGADPLVNTVTVTYKDALNTEKTASASRTVRIQAPPPVGGVWAPTNKFQLLAPWIGLASLMTVFAASVVYVKHRKMRQD
jgi:uncharacterized repeat protein (TIGR01451 family)